jgi:hypothetical protein
MGFAQLVSLCEAHNVIDKPVADIIRKVNALRNRCAHQLTFNPHWHELDSAIEEIAPQSGEGEDKDGLRRLADLLERRALEIGATVV